MLYGLKKSVILLFIVMGREIQQKVKELVLEEATRRYSSIDRRIACDILSKAWGQFIYDRNIWGQTFRKLSRDPRLDINDCPESKRSLEINSEALYRFTLEQKEATQILMNAYADGHIIKNIPQDLSDDYITKWISKHRVSDLISNPHDAMPPLHQSLNVNNLSQTLQNGGIVLRVTKTGQGGGGLANASSQQTTASMLIKQECLPFNLQAPGKSDTRWSDLVLNGQSTRVKRCRASLAIYQTTCPRLCIFYLTTDLTMILLYHGLQGQSRMNVCDPSSMLRISPSSSQRCDALSRSSTTCSYSKLTSTAASSGSRDVYPPRDIIPLSEVGRLWNALPQIRSHCLARSQRAYLLHEAEQEIYLIFVNESNHQIEEVSRWSLSTTMSLSCAAEPEEKPEPDDYITIDIKEAPSPPTSRKRRRCTWQDEALAAQCEEIRAGRRHFPAVPDNLADKLCAGSVPNSHEIA